MNLSIGLPDSPDRFDVGKVLRALTVAADRADIAFAQRVADSEDDIKRMLADDPEALQRFRTDPIGVLTERFPKLEPPKRRLIPIPKSVVESTSFTRAEPPTEAEELLAKVSAWVAQSQPNTTRFSTEPFIVLNEQAVGYSAQVVTQVRDALSTALGVVRPSMIPELAEFVIMGRI